MTREEAAAYLSNCADGLDNDFDEAVELAVACLRAQEKAEAKAEKKEPLTMSGWISVKDRLPELIPCNAGTAYSDAVIVFTSGRKAMVAVYNGTCFWAAATYWDAEGETITHWMPLPDPPGEEKRDG